MRLIPTMLLLILFANLSMGAGSIGKKASFTENDIFRSAYFLKNTDGLVTDYNGAPVHYFTRRGAVNAFFTDNTLIYRVVNLDSNRTKEIREEAEEAEEKSGKPGKDNDYKPVALNMRYVSVTWLGANPHPVIESQEMNSGYYTYLAGTSKQDRHSIVTQGFKKIIYHNLYPGIDVDYVLPEKGGMEYTLTVHPGADLSQVKMQYGMDITGISNNGQGSITIHTQAGDIVEHAPVSYLANGTPVASNFILQGNVASFATPQGYDHNSTLIVDPWVDVLTQLTTSNVGTMTDFDATGNLYVYGAGATGYSDLSTYYKSAKFDVSGNNLWVFNGNVPLVGWSSQDPSGSWNYLSGMKVDRTTGKTYYGQGYAINGSQIVRLTAAGLYDNFESPANGIFRETWSFVSNCLTGDILALGGGTNSDLNMGVVNPITAALTTSNITGDLADYQQDIVSGAYDANGNLYAVFASVAAFTVDNVMYKSNSTYTGSVWSAATGFTPFNESNNIPNFSQDVSNNFNALAANGSYLYYFDGQHLAAYSLTTGAQVGNTRNVAGYTALYQGGIAVDNCNNVYIGGIGVIKTYSFNGTTFTAGTDISLGAGFTSDYLLDVRYNSTNNLLYVTGNGIVGTYTATNSATCNVVSTFTSSVTPGCGKSIVHVTPGVGLTNPVFSYLWEDSAGNIIKQTAPGTATNDTLSTTTPGLYTVQIQLNINCGGAAQTDTFRVVCEQLTVSPDTTVCAGQQVNLRAYGTPAGGTYLWSPGGQTTSSITVTPPAGVTYYHVTYTVPGQPPLTDSIKVTTTSGPTVAVSDTSICAGGTASLSATPSLPGGTYLWAPGGATTQSITVSPTSTSTYTVTYATAHCGNATGSGTVTIVPTAVTTHDTTVCAGQTVTLTATANLGGGIYVWTPGPDSTQNYTVSPTSTTTYTVIYTKAGCRPDTAKATVNTTPDPTLSVNDTAFCAGGSGVLTATPSIPGGTYLWAPGGATSPSITVSPGTSTTYTVTYSLLHCGTAVDSGIVSVVQRPILTTSDTAVCTGGTITISANANIGGGLFIWSPGPDSTQSITVTPATTSTYTVVYTVAGCAPDTANLTVNVISAATVSVAPDTICAGNTATLTAVPTPGGGTYLWAPGGATTQSITVSPTSNTSYTVTYNSGTCGLAVDSNTIVVLPKPVLTTHDTVACIGQSVTLTASATVSGGLYVWTPGPDSTQNYTVSPVATTTYTVIYSIRGCAPDTAQATFTVTPPPTVALGADTTICAGATATLNAIPNPAGGSYAWAPGGAVTQGISVTPALATTYTVTYSIAGCPSASATETVNIFPPFALSFVSDTPLCFGAATGAVIATVTPAGTYTYSWNNGNTTATNTNVGAGSYTLTVTDANGCTANGSAVVAQGPTATLETFPADTTVLQGNSVQLTTVFTPSANVSGVTYAWTADTTLSCLTCPNPLVSTNGNPDTFNVYHLTVTYNGGCTVTATDTVHVLLTDICVAPNAFSPNGDGKNDTYYILAHGEVAVKLDIYNRWGQLVFSSNDIHQGWDGTYRGKDQPQGEYTIFYSVTYRDGKYENHTGSIMLFR